VSLRVGDVFFERVRAISNRDKKYFIIVCSVDPVRFVLINTRNAVDVLCNPDLAPTQVPALASDFEFLRYDSWIGCNELFGGYNAEELAALIAAGHRRGTIGNGLLNLILNAIDASKTIPGRQKLRCVDDIKSELARRAQGTQGN